MRNDILDFASRHSGADKEKCRLDNDAVVCGNKRILLTELGIGYRLAIPEPAAQVAAQ